MSQHTSAQQGSKQGMEGMVVVLNLIKLVSLSTNRHLVFLNEEVQNKNILREVHTNAMIGQRPFARFWYLRDHPLGQKSCALAGMAPALKYM